MGRLAHSLVVRKNDVAVNEEPNDIRCEFGRVIEQCEFCRTPTRFWTLDSRTIGVTEIFSLIMKS